MTKKVDFIAGLSLIILIALLFSIFSLKANLDLTEGRHALSMDELITFDGVKDILSAKSIKEAIDTTLRGDNRYGRILCNTATLFSIIPAYFLGDTGIIVATRVMLTLALISAYLILCFTFIRSWVLRSLLFLFLLSIPTTVYYSTMPKPEPLQLLFISLFLFRAKQNNFSLGPHWFFIGMAFGAKISALFLIPYFGIIALLQNKRDLLSLAFWKTVLKTLGFFVLGFLIAEGSIILSFITLSLQPVSRYVSATFLNTGDSASNMIVNLNIWLNTFLKGYTNIPEGVVILIIALIASLIIAFITKRIRYKALYFQGDKDLYKSSLLVILSGIVLIFPIMLAVSRIWVFYLHIGIALLLAGVVALCELNIKPVDKKNTIDNILRIISVAVVSIMLLASVLYLVPGSRDKFIALSERSKSPEHQVKLKEHRFLKTLFYNISQQFGRKIRVWLDPSLFVIDSGEHYSIQRFWGTFLHWKSAAHLVVYYPGHVPRDEASLEGYAVDESKRQEDELFNKYVCSDDYNERKEGCFYFPLESKIENLRIYIRIDVLKKIQQNYLSILP